MKVELVRSDLYSGDKATVYEVFIDDREETLLDQFILEHQELFRQEVRRLLDRLRIMGNDTGAQDYLFQPKAEGELGDGLRALADNPDKSLRLYCIQYGTQVIVVGGGGPKPKKMRTLQESPKLKKENYLLRQVSALITNAIRDKDFRWSADGMALESDTNDLLIDNEY